MFHTFSSEAPRLPRRSVSTLPSTPRRVNRSCVECTRRKIKCDGGQPCANCRSYRIGPACGYRHRSRRHAVSVNDFQEVADELEVHRSVLRALFPNLSVDLLRDKGRDQLLQLLNTVPPEEAVPGPEDDIDDSGQVSENGEEPDRQWDEVQENVKSSDDINAISLAYDQHRRSYLGVTSVSAILRSIFRLCPSAKSHVAQNAKSWPRPVPSIHIERRAAPTESDDVSCVEAYFNCFQSITPMVNEADFKITWRDGNRTDASWLGLFNMVCTMGSIAAGDENMHALYYQRAQAYLSLETFGSGNLESLQALCLLGGYYLQYQNSPNMATAVLGAAHRMALALGLHRESKRGNLHASPRQDTKTGVPVSSVSRVESRRRTWWSLFCFDVWTSMTMGRPTCGRWDATTMDVHLPDIAACADYATLPLYASAKFCLIANRIQDRLAHIGRTPIGDVLAFDKELEDWYTSLPDVLKAPTTCPPLLTIARDFMYNRYMNLRLILFRPLLIYLPNSRSSTHEIIQQDTIIHERCHQLTSEAIKSISRNWTHNRVHVWSAAWYLFQAVMVPLLSLARKTGDHAADALVDIAPAMDNVRKVLDLLNQMTPWMRSADRSRHIVGAIFEAISDAETHRTPSVSEGDNNFFGWYDDQVTFGDEIDWSAFLVDDESLVTANWGTN